MSHTTSSKALLKHRSLRLAQNPAALSLESVLALAGQLRDMAGDLPAVAGLVDAVERWGIAKRDKRIADNMGLVFNLVYKRYHFVLELLGIPEEDAQQEGVIGLMRAAMMYDELRPVAFSTYATPWIKNFLSRLIQDDTTIHVPGYIQDEQRKEAQTTGDRGDLHYQHVQRCLSLDRRWGEDEEKSLAHFAADPSAPCAINHSDACADLAPLLESLRPKERLLLECRYLRGLTLDETAAELARLGLGPRLTRERVRQLVEEALRFLRIRARVLHGINRKKRRLA